MTPARNPSLQNRLGIAAGQRLQEIGIARHALNWRSVEYNSSTNRHHRRKLPDDKSVPGQKQRGFRQFQPRKRLLAGSDLFRFVQHNLSHSFHRVRMKMHPRAVLQRPRRRRQQAQSHISAPRNLERCRRRQSHAARQVFRARARNVQRSPLARDRRLRGLPMHLHAAHAHTTPRRKNFHFIFAANRPRHQRASHHRAKTLHGKNAIDRQPRNRARIPRLHFGRCCNNRPIQLFQSRTGQGTHGDNRI